MVRTKDGYDRAKIAAKVGDTVKDFMGRYFLKPSDIKEVVHLVDLDGAYISDDKVIQTACQKPFYTDENIQTSNVDGIQRRNQQKIENLNRLISLGKVYKIFPTKFFSSPATLIMCFMMPLIYRGWKKTNMLKDLRVNMLINLRYFWTF